MKKSHNKLILALTIAGSFLCFVKPAFALDEKDVKDLWKHLDFYGVIDFGATYVDNEGGKSSLQARDSVNWGNRLGVKGNFPLTDGYNAIFTLEHGFHLSDGDTSQYDTTWGRQAFAGITHEKYGSLTVGRQYDFIYDNLNQVNIGGYATTYGGHHGDLDRISGWRVDKSIKYVSPSLNGWTLGAMYGSDRNAYASQAGTGQEETISLGAKYNSGGPWGISAAYIHINDTTVYPYLTLGLSSLLGVSDSGNGIQADQETLGIGGYRQLGKFTLVANTTATKLSNDSQDATQHVYEMGGYYPIAPKTLLIGAYQHSTLDGHKWDQITAGVKRDITSYAWMYAAYSWLKASDGVLANQGAGWYLDNSDDDEQQTIRLGMVLAF